MFQEPTLKAARTSSFEKGFRWMTTEGALDLPLPNAGRRPPLVVNVVSAIQSYRIHHMWTFRFTYLLTYLLFPRQEFP